MQGALSTVILIRAVLGFLFAWSATQLEALMWATRTIPSQVDRIWMFVRDFANMGFILALIIMAFGTIFNIHKYTFRDVFMWFLISALLINFSLPIGKYIIQTGDGLSHVVITTTEKALGGPLWQTIAGRGLVVQKVTGNLASDLTCSIAGPLATYVASKFIPGVDAAKCGGTLTEVILAVIYLLFAILAYLVVLVMLLARAPVLWVLLIVSPIAWLGLALPNLNGLWKAWWKHFISWVFWFPAYLGILMLLMILLTARDQNPFNFATATGGDIFAQIFGLNDLIFFIISLFFLVGGVIASFKVGHFIGGSAGMVGDWIQERVQKLPVVPVRSGGRWKMIGVEGAVKGLYEGAQAPFKRLAESQEEKEKLFKAGVAKRFTEGANVVGGALKKTPFGFHLPDDKEYEKGVLKNIQHEAELLENTVKNEKILKEELEHIKENKQEGSDHHLALQYLQAKNGWFSENEEGLHELEDALSRVGGSGTKAGKELLKLTTKNDMNFIEDSRKAMELIQKAKDEGKELDKGIQVALHAGFAKSLPDIKHVKEYFRLTENESYEEKEKVKDQVKESLKKLYRTLDEREKALTASDDEVPNKAKKLVATIMKESDQIKEFRVYDKAVLAYGRGSAKAHELLEAISTKSPLMGKEFALREKGIDLSTIGVGDIEEAFKYSTLDKVAEASDELWKSNAFKEILTKRVAAQEELDRTQKAEGTHRQHDGGGRKYLKDLAKVTTSGEKRKVIREIVDDYIRRGIWTN